MARAVECDFFTYKFRVCFRSGSELVGGKLSPSNPGERALTSVRHTADGLEFRGAHRAGESLLIRQIGEAVGVDIAIFASKVLSRDAGGALVERPSRILSYLIGDPVAMPAWLDATDGAAAIDGVLFRKATFIRSEDRVLSEDERL